MELYKVLDHQSYSEVINSVEMSLGQRIKDNHPSFLSIFMSFKLTGWSGCLFYPNMCNSPAVASLFQLEEVSVHTLRGVSGSSG